MSGTGICMILRNLIILFTKGRSRLDKESYIVVLTMAWDRDFYDRLKQKIHLC
jgi:hypothetical protein